MLQSSDSDSKLPIIKFSTGNYEQTLSKWKWTKNETNNC